MASSPAMSVSPVLTTSPTASAAGAMARDEGESGVPPFVGQVSKAREKRVGAPTADRGTGGKGMSNILCCLCGRSIQPNGANMCGACLQDQVDVTADIPRKGLVIIQCRRCLRWLTKKDNWSVFELESAPFLALVLKKIPGLAKQDLVDAKWIWTEPHSKRLKVKITVRKEVLDKVMLQQDAVVEFVVHNRQCNTCNKEFTNQTWKAVVQIRQRAGHKRTMLLLEQQILQADAHHKCLNVEPVRGGMDVFFGARQDAAEFVGFLSSVTPIRSRESAKLVSTDNHSNVRNSQHTVAVDIPPLCRDDLVVLPKNAGNRLQGSLCVVQRVTSTLQMIGPFTGERADITADRYWRSPLEALLSAASLVEFVVLDCEPMDRRNVSKGGPDEKPSLWEVVVALASEVGSEEHTFTVSTHLGVVGKGRALEAGDTLLGYDLRDKNFNEAVLKGLSRDLPDIALVKKAPPPKSARSKKKRHKLQSIHGGAAALAPRDGDSGRKAAAGGRDVYGDDVDDHEVAAILEELELSENAQEELETAHADEENGGESNGAGGV